MTGSQLRLGCFLPQGWRHDLPTGGPEHYFETMVGVALRAERAGFGAVWVYDHLRSSDPGPPGPILDPLIALAVVAWATTQVRVGTMCLALPRHHLGPLAHQLANLDVLSGGRLEVGLGAGSDARELRAFGLPTPALRERILAAGEAAELLRACWTGDPTHFEGRYTVVDGAAVTPRPLQQPFPPVWIAGGGERLTLWQVARHADGCSLFGPPERVSRKLDVLAEHCRQVGRPLHSVRVAVVLDCLVGDTEVQADRLVERYNRHGEERSKFRARRLVGTPEGCAQQLQAYLDLGVSEVCCHFPDALESDSPERLASAVLAGRPGDPQQVPFQPER